VKLPKLLYLQEPKRPFYEPMPRLPWIAKDPQSERGFRKLRTAVTELIDLRSVSIQGREELNNAKSYDRMLVNSFFSREAMLRAYGISAKVCYLGADPGKFKDLGLQRENLVMGIGTLGPSKNVRLAVEGVGRVPKAIRPKLVWVANMVSPPYRDECIQLAHELDVEFEPKEMIPDDELVSLLNRASLMVYAPRLEPFGFAPLEANFCALPVVAVAEGGVRETVVDGLNGLLVDHDPELLGSAISKLLTDDNLRTKLAKQGYRTAHEKWGVTASVDRLEAEIFSLLGLTAPSAKPLSQNGDVLS
jgi:glycosyltransferase involved in cell wall biosynthesis